MTQIDVSLTDYGLASECLWFSLRMARTQAATTSRLRRLFAAFFLSIAVAALAGGTVHGFFLDESSLGYRVLWPLTLITLGVTALVGVQIAARLQLSLQMVRQVEVSAVALFIAYCVVVLFVRRDFRIAILGYIPGLVLLGMAFFLAHRREKQPLLLVGFGGVCLMLLAAAAQQAKLGLHPIYFDHNALYHLLQGLALFMVFLAGRACIELAETIQ